MLFSIYLHMFAKEDTQTLLFSGSLDPHHIRNLQIPYYNRATFVAFLSLVKENAGVDWGEAMDILQILLYKDRTLAVG